MSTNGSVLLAAGYLYDQQSFRYVPVLALFTVDLVQWQITLLETKQLVADVLLYPFQVGSYDLEYGMSVDLNSGQPLALVGVAKYDTVILVQLSSTTGISFVKNLVWKSESTQLLAGKSVIWLDQQTAAVLFYALASRPWSPSQIQVRLEKGISFQICHSVALQVFDLKTILSTGNGSSLPLPLYSIPNNQVTIFPRLRFSNFISLIPWPLHLVVLTQDGYVIFLSTSPPGTHPIPSPNCTVCLFYFYTTLSCLPGMSKETTSFEPCTVCPPQTYSSGQTNTTCLTCSQKSFCPLGAVIDMDSTHLTDLIQATAYPESPESTFFDDILIQSM